MTEPVWLTAPIVQALHSAQLSEHGGQHGLRDPGLLESALARPRNTWADEPLARLAADYAFGLARNHAFIDGNKRIAFVAANVFLLLNDQEIDAPEPEVVDITFRVAAGHLDRDTLAAWIEAHLTRVR